jgi:hypothetical protein
MTGASTLVDDLSSAAAVVTRPSGRGPAAKLPVDLFKRLDSEVIDLAAAMKKQRNALREEQKRVRALTRPAWLTQLARQLRAMLESLPERQYLDFLRQWELTDPELGAWLDGLAVGIDLDDTVLVERLRALQTNLSRFLVEFGAVRDVVPSDEDGQPTAARQLQFDLLPIVHSVEARLLNLRLNVPAADNAGPS